MSRRASNEGPEGSSGSGRPSWELSASESLAAVATGERSVSEVVGGLVERVRERDGELGAFRICDFDAVQRRAKDLDDTVAGPLWGLAVGVKDVIDTVDLPTGYGSPLFADHRPSEDARAVATLRRAGAIVLGKTESTEFALYEPTRTRNPEDPTRTPGGSSSGSAAAVAAGMVPVALGTQTAGSIVRPAAYCGVYGYKPSWGWTSTAGVWRLSERLDTLGMFARTAADLELLHRAIARDINGGSSSPASRRRPTPLPRRAAVLSTEAWGVVDRDVLDALERLAGRLEGAGWRVSGLSMPHTWRRLPEHHRTVMAVEVAKNMHRALGARIELISEGARGIVEQGDACPAPRVPHGSRGRQGGPEPPGTPRGDDRPGPRPEHARRRASWASFHRRSGDVPRLDAARSAGGQRPVPSAERRTTGRGAGSGAA